MFELSINLSRHCLAEIKAELTLTLSHIKSSHRCEAVARGLGFQTFASLLAAADAGNGISSPASGERFCRYLEEHHFRADYLHFYRAVGRAALRKVLHDTPMLTHAGIGVGGPRNTNGKWETSQEYSARVAEARGSLAGDNAVFEFLRSLAFLSLVPPTRTVRPNTSSYWLKHIAENFPCTYPEGKELGPDYVANGALIAAAIHLGFKYRIHTDNYGREMLNVSFNMSKPSLNDLDCRIRRDGARATERRRREQERLQKLEMRELAQNVRRKLAAELRAERMS